MELHIVGRGFKATDAIRGYVEKKISPVVSKFIADRSSVVVHVRLEDINGPKGGVDKRVSVDVRFPKKHHVRVTDDGEELYQTIDVVAKELENVLKKEKEKYLANNGRPEKSKSLSL